MTYAEAYQLIPDPECRGKALKNTPFPLEEMPPEVDNVGEALKCGFVWHRTLEGRDYWIKAVQFLQHIKLTSHDEY